jgi:hypothetical protein
MDRSVITFIKLFLAIGVRARRKKLGGGQKFAFPKIPVDVGGGGWEKTNIFESYNKSNTTLWKRSILIPISNNCPTLSTIYLPDQAYAYMCSP